MSDVKDISDYSKAFQPKEQKIKRYQELYDTLYDLMDQIQEALGQSHPEVVNVLDHLAFAARQVHSEKVKLQTLEPLEAFVDSGRIVQVVLQSITQHYDNVVCERQDDERLRLVFDNEDEYQIVVFKRVKGLGKPE